MNEAKASVVDETPEFSSAKPPEKNEEAIEQAKQEFRERVSAREKALGIKYLAAQGFVKVGEDTYRIAFGTPYENREATPKRNRTLRKLLSPISGRQWTKFRKAKKLRQRIEEAKRLPFVGDAIN